MNKIVWAYWPTYDTTENFFRSSYKNIFSRYEFPVDRFNVTGYDEYNVLNIVDDPTYNLSNTACDWRERYFSVIDEVADRVFKTAGDRRIALYYSGGIDSTVVLTALMRHQRFAEFNESDRLEIRLTSSSVNENPWMFYNKILPTWRHIKHTMYDQSMIDNDVMMVTGDMGDYVIGSSDILSLAVKDDFELTNSYVDLLNIISQADKTGAYHSALIDAIKKCPFTIESGLQLIWWHSQCFAFQDEFARPYYWSNAVPVNINSQNKVFKFFYDPSIITYSYEYMSTNPKIDSFTESRILPKDYISNFTGNDHYDQKIKLFSQRQVPKIMKKSVIYENGSFAIGSNVRVSL